MQAKNKFQEKEFEMRFLFLLFHFCCIGIIFVSGCVKHEQGRAVNPPLFSSGEHYIKVTTNPQGAKVFADNTYVGNSPCWVSAYSIRQFSISKAISSPKTIRVEKEGYIQRSINLASRWELDSFYILNLTLDPAPIHQNISFKGKNLKEIKDEAHTMPISSWAVIIGISKYQYSGQNGLTNLIFADDDAKAFARSLRNLGWNESHIKLLVNEDATQRNIMIALESWLSKAGPNDQIILFWAGHGFPDPEDPEKVYFACYDTDISIPVTGYRMDRVRRALEERKTKNVILLADTCHAGKLITRGERGISIVPQIEKMRKDRNVPKGWIFMVGADTDRQAIEHTSWKNGAFTHSLIRGLEGKADGFQSAGRKDDIVTMGELRAYMNTIMPDETQKVLGVAKRPVITTSTGDPNIWDLTLQVSR